jgi:hypothetical protein
MPEANPFAPPVAPISGGEGSGGRELFADLDTRTLKKLRDNSNTVRALGVLWALATPLYAVVGATTLGSGLGGAGAAFAGISLAMVALFGIGSCACFARPAWGRALGIILNAIALLVFPVGTLIGIFGLIAFVGGERLFGAHRLPHADLQREFKQRKQNRIV